MKNRFRVEIYDANKLNDLTIYSDSGVDKEYLTELVISNIKQFSGRVNAYAYDAQKKKKITAMFFDEDTVQKLKNKTQNATRINFQLEQSWDLPALPPYVRGYPQGYGRLWITLKM